MRSSDETVYNRKKYTLHYRSAGDFGNVLLFVSTCVVSFCMLKKLPSEDLFDENWLSNGFCVSNQETRWWNSHTLSFYADTLLTLIVWYIQKNSLQDSNVAADIPPLHKAIVAGAVMGIFGHGLGHLSLGLGTTFDLRINPDKLMNTLICQIVNVLGFGSIFLGTMPLASKTTQLITAIIATLGFTVFDVEPNLNFVYAQAAIYISSALMMISLPAKDKDAAMYAIYPYFQLPVLAVGILESIGCMSILEPIGGHVIYDSMIGGMIILQHFFAIRMEQSRLQDAVKNKII